MSYFESIVLAIVQGLTEFLPISSSAHLILAPVFFGWEDQGLAFDVAVHLGSLSAVCIYFRHDIWVVSRAWFASVLARRAPDKEALFGWYVLAATVPVGLAGLVLNDLAASYLRDPMIIAATTALFGVLLWAVDRRGGKGLDEHSMTLRIALLIGCAQAMALVPGTSRSGITITAGLMFGLSRVAAARFSFMMAIPVIFLASLLQTKTLIETPGPVQWDVIALGTVVSGVSAYLCIEFFLRLMNRVSMLPFAIYRVLLAGVIVVAFV